MRPFQALPHVRACVNTCMASLECPRAAFALDCNALPHRQNVGCKTNRLSFYMPYDFLSFNKLLLRKKAGTPSKLASFAAVTHTAINTPAHVD